MRIIVCLSYLYIGDVYHNYLNALYYANRYDDSILTQEEYIDKPLEYDWATIKLYGNIQVAECVKKEIPHFYLPSTMINCQRADKNWTQIAISEFTQENLFYQDNLTKQIESYLKKSGKNFDGFIVFGETPCFVHAIAQNFNVPILNYEFTSIRSTSGSTLNLLYGVKENLYGNKECFLRYQNFLKEESCTLLSRRELIALFYPIEKLCLIPALEYIDGWEFGIAEGEIYGPVFCKENYINLDIFREVLDSFSRTSIVSKRHPGYSQLTSQREGISKDPTEFILSCKRIGATSSNMLFESMLWNRTAYSTGTVMPFSFMCEHDVKSTITVPSSFLNFFLFSFLVPGLECLFDPQYWAWRQTRPPENIIYKRHIEIIFNYLKISLDILNLDEETRFKKILSIRGCNKGQIEQIESDCKTVSGFNICRNIMRSSIKIVGNNNPESKITNYWCLNKTEDTLIYSAFQVSLQPGTLFHFIPLGDRSGFVEIQDIKIDDISAFSKIGKKYFTVLGCSKEKMCFFSPMDIIPIKLSNNCKNISRIVVIWKYRGADDDILKRTSSILYSRSYRIGRIATWLPRKLRALLKKE